MFAALNYFLQQPCLRKSVSILERNYSMATVARKTMRIMQKPAGGKSVRPKARERVFRRWIIELQVTTFTGETREKLFRPVKDLGDKPGTAACK